MFDFIKQLFGSKPKRKRSPHPPSIKDIKISFEFCSTAQFGGGAGVDNTNAVWPEVWPEALRIDERFSKIPIEELSAIEAAIKEGISTGVGAQKTATKLRPVFEGVGLRRKDALALAAKAYNLTYDAINKGTTVGVNFVTKDGVETAEDFVAKALKNH